VKGWESQEWGDDFEVDVVLSSADAEDYDALVLPGGVMNPDKLRAMPEARAFVRAFAENGKPIAAICHGPWTLIDAGLADGKKMTSWPSLETDLVGQPGGGGGRSPRHQPQAGRHSRRPPRAVAQGCEALAAVGQSATRRARLPHPGKRGPARAGDSPYRPCLRSSR
jgi:putative intracellular protease/amidase